jgi:hypothetical protein
MPSVLTEFPLNLILLLLPFGLCLLIPRLHQSRPPTLSLFAQVAGAWTGYAVMFHAYYGFWDGQGIAIGIVGTVVTFPIVWSLGNRRGWAA